MSKWHCAEPEVELDDPHGSSWREPYHTKLGMILPLESIQIKIEKIKAIASDLYYIINILQYIRMAFMKAEQYVLQSCFFLFLSSFFSLFFFFLYGDIAIPKNFLRDAFYQIWYDTSKFSKMLEKQHFFLLLLFRCLCFCCCCCFILFSFDFLFK